LPVNIVLIEKEAGISFCIVGGKADYVDFAGKDPMFLGWAKDLFCYYWERGKIVTPQNMRRVAKSERMHTQIFMSTRFGDKLNRLCRLLDN
jgi:hypothetical protein